MRRVVHRWLLCLAVVSSGGTRRLAYVLVARQGLGTGKVLPCRTINDCQSL